MKRSFFIKFDPRINQLTGCDRATLILGKLEYWFRKQPDGFYKFIEPCSHCLYKKGDSWAEELGCDRKCFARAWKKIGVKYKSRLAFEAAEDKFQGKMYASYYDRYTNRTFFIRNHDLANETLKEFFGCKKPKQKNSLERGLTELLEPLSSGHNIPSYRDTKSTSSELFKNNSHANNEIVKQMVEIWVAIVEQGKEKITLTSKRIAFLKQALKDKFDNCLEKWEKYCETIASSRFLMGEIKSFKATLDWVLKFENIQKILEGHYGIGDRAVKVKEASEKELQEEIEVLDEELEIKDFRAKCLKIVGHCTYHAWFRKLKIEKREEGCLALIAPHAFHADYLERNYDTYLKIILEKLEKTITCFSIFASGEPKEKCTIERERLAEKVAPKEKVLKNDNAAKKPYKATTKIRTLIFEKTLKSISPETQALREKLKRFIPLYQLSSWLNQIEVEDIRSDGTLIITLQDSFAVKYCKNQFSQEILWAAKILWDYVKVLVIKSRLIESFQAITDKKEPENQKNFSFEETLQSFIAACFSKRLLGVSEQEDRLIR